MPHAAAADVAALLARELTPEETAMVERRLAQVERMILRRIPNLDTKLDDGDIDHADVVDIEADAVTRVVRNPEGLLSENDGTYGYQFDRDISSGKLEILPEEWKILGVSAPRGMFAIVPRLVAPVRNPAFGSGG